MAIREELRAIVAAIPAELIEDKGLFSFSFLVAERKAFLSRRKLVYSARFRIDDRRQELIFSEMLKEMGFGLSTGSGMDDMSPGFGFKKTTARTGFGPREGVIEEQSSLFGKKYNYTFDFGKLRERIKAAATAAGYSFSYKLTL